MKKVQYTVMITFITIMASLCFCSLFADSDGFSSFENRYLCTRPEFSAEAFLNGEFTGEYESYLLDNFLLRDISIMGFQSYSNILYVDAFSDSETVIANVDIDDFVRAGGQDGVDVGIMDNGQTGIPQTDPMIANEGKSGYGSDQPGTAEGLSTQGQLADGNQIPQTGDQGSMPGQQQDQGEQVGSQGGTDQETESGQTPSPEQQGGDQNDAVEDSTAMSQQDTKLNNSLIISGDRVMMPTGAYNFRLYSDILTEFTEIMPELNIYSITGPTSAAFYASDKYSAGSYDQSKAEKTIAANAVGVTVVKAYDKLREHSDEDIYFRSDVHWTAVGAYYAYVAFCESAGMEPADLEEDFVKDTYKPFLGGLYAQIYKMPQASRLKNNPEQLDYYIPRLGHQVTLYTMGNLNNPNRKDSIINTDFKSLGVYKYACFAWGDQHLERIDTDNPNGRKVVVIKDSYGSALIPFLVHNYSTVFVIDPKGFNSEGLLTFDAKTLIREEKIDDVVFCFSIYGSGRQIIRDRLTSLLLK